MEDRELLELAAKAAGFEMAHTGENETVIWLIKPGSVEDCHGERAIFPWNPLTQDGDALRLAVKLRFTVDHSSSSNYCYAGIPFKGLHAGNDEDQCKATRYAIVSAAAEIGRSMP